METDAADDDDVPDTTTTTSPVVRDLSKALLQIKQMVEPRYMRPPLGADDKTRAQKQKEALELAPTSRIPSYFAWRALKREKTIKSSSAKGSASAMRTPLIAISHACWT